MVIPARAAPECPKQIENTGKPRSLETVREICVLVRSYNFMDGEFFTFGSVN